jgi:hypothetical protein
LEEHRLQIEEDSNEVGAARAVVFCFRLKRFELLLYGRAFVKAAQSRNQWGQRRDLLERPIEAGIE